MNFLIFFELIHVLTKKSNLEWIKSRMNQISNESNLEWIKSWMNQISNESNLDFDATFVECIWHLRRIPNTNLSRRNSTVKWHLSRITKSAKYAKILSGFWGFCFRILGITQDFGDTAYSGFCFMFEYTRNILFDLFSNIVTGRWLLLTVSWLGLKLESYGSISLWNSAFWNSAFWNSRFGIRRFGIRRFRIQVLNQFLI